VVFFFFFFFINRVQFDPKFQTGNKASKQ